jgi:PAS domain S-box-containing protein
VSGVTVPSDRISLLYVDDEPNLLDTGKLFLERGGDFSVDTVMSAAEALSSLERTMYDAVISDYQMPEMDGIKLLTEIRSRYPDLPFILFTGKGRETVVIQAFDAGADYYVQKGGDPRSQFRELSHKIRLAVERRQVGKALKSREEQYRNVVEDQTEFICRFRPDGTHNFVNDAYCRYFGMRREEFIGRRFIPTVPEEDRELIRVHFSSLTPDKPVNSVEHRVIVPDGSVRWHQWTDRAIFDPSGTLVEYQSVGRDITDRKTAELSLNKKNEELCTAYGQLTAIEEELRSSFDDLAGSQRTLEAREMILNAIIQESPIPQFVIDRNHQILYWNHALAASSGISFDEMSGTDQHWRAFYPVQRPCLADLLVENALDEIPEWYPARYSRSILIEDAYEATDFFPHVGLEGRWLHITAGLIKNRGGETIGAIESLEDITERKIAELDLARKNEELFAAYEQVTAIEEELRMNLDDLGRSQRALKESEERYRSIVEDQMEFICRFTPEGRLTFVNDAYCRYFGLDKHTCIGMHHTVVIPPEDLPRVKQHLDALKPENPVAVIEHRIMMPSGEIRWQRWSDRAFYDAKGRIVEYQSVGRDTTDHQHAEPPLSDAGRKTGLIESVLRPDLPSRPDRSAAPPPQSTGKTQVLPDQSRDHNGREEEPARILRDQILFIREYLTIGMHKPSWQSLSDTILSATSRYPSSQFRWVPATLHIDVYADPLLEHVFSNLFENAIRHARGITEVTIKGEETGRGFVITVKDTGCGIPLEEKETVFRRRFSENTGSCLYLTREILAVTGITIRESGEPGLGACFEITVPPAACRPAGERTG